MAKVLAGIRAGLGDQADPCQKGGVGFVSQWIHGLGIGGLGCRWMIPLKAGVMTQIGCDGLDRRAV